MNGTKHGTTRLNQNMLHIFFMKYYASFLIVLPYYEMKEKINQGLKKVMLKCMTKMLKDRNALHVSRSGG